MNHPLWTQAEAAEREGRYADAEKAYFDLAALMNGAGGDHDIANLCYTRIHALREKKRNAGAATAVASGTGTLQPPAPRDDGRGVRPGAPQALPAAASTEHRHECRHRGREHRRPEVDRPRRAAALAADARTAPASRLTRSKARRVL